MSTADAAEAFASEAGTTPVIVSGVDAPAVISPTPEPSIPNSKFYTEEDLVKARKQEKDKLYPEIEGLKEELQNLRREKEEKAARRAAEEADKAAKMAEKEKQQLEEDLSAKDLIKLKENEWQEQLERERQERERAFALLEQERAFAELQNYRVAVVDSERDNIIPELLDLVVGNTKEEIDASIAGLKERSSRILENAQQAMQAARRDMTGTRVTSPQSGPLDINTGNRQFTAEEIAAMPLNEYAKYRDQFLSPTARGRSKGMLG